jgi:large subunit ribosomal protein L17
MRHRKAGKRLGRTTSHRAAMLRNMVTSLFEHERIVTTTPKAKELRKLADHLMTLAKRGDLHARRQALAVIRSKKIVAKLFDEIKNDYMDRSGGYTRIIKTGSRTGDAASMAIIELVNYQEEGQEEIAG